MLIPPAAAVAQALPLALIALLALESTCIPQLEFTFALPLSTNACDAEGSSTYMQLVPLTGPPTARALTTAEVILSARKK